MLTEIAGGGKFDFEHWAQVLSVRIEKGLSVINRSNYFDYMKFMKKKEIDNSIQLIFERAEEGFKKE